MGGMVSEASSPSHKVTLLARGDHMRAMQASRGIRLSVNQHDPRKKREMHCGNVNLVSSLAEAAQFGPFDFILLTVKAHQICDVALDWKTGLMNANTCIFTLQNGLPWWFFLGPDVKGRFAGRRISCLDPDGVLEAVFPASQIVGGVALPASYIAGPGHIVHESGWGFHLGHGHRAETLSRILTQSGFDAPIKNIREELWIKVMGSAFFNPASVLTGATLTQMTTFSPDTCRIAMDEVRAVALSADCVIKVSNERRLEGAKRVGDHKTSMLLDVEAGKVDLELDALVTSVLEVASWTKVPTPTLSVIHSLVQLKQHVMKSKL